ncbi:GNAT family N-acetyltransferase [Rhodococcus sp. NPDC127528]|uniref:GNAT family N-acetyltransferase n=1 Tax=unclassified Rhodococcus (in: high G+C Gram-positive bacteria) TaxID=192944 RepID=UPI0036439609
MTMRINPLTLDGLDQLPRHSRRCVFWEMDPTALRRSREFSDPEFEKEAWLSMVMLEWGSCGQVATLDGRPAGCALYSPPGDVPRAKLFPTSPVSPDAVLLTTMRLEPAAQLDGVGPSLIQAVVGDLVRRGVRALEAFGIVRGPEDEESAGKAGHECGPEECMIEASFLEDMGFEVVAAHRRYPRLRLELDRDHGWKADVESALEQLLIAAALSVVDIEHKSTVGAV